MCQERDEWVVKFGTSSANIRMQGTDGISEYSLPSPPTLSQSPCTWKTEMENEKTTRDKQASLFSMCR